MKKLILLLAVLGATSAGAVGSGPLPQSGISAPVDGGPESQPVRQANMKTVFFKAVAQQAEDGSYFYVRDKVCELNDKLGVYDITKAYPGWNLYKKLTCSVNHNDKTYDITVAGIGLAGMTWHDGQPMKAFSFNLSTFNKQESPAPLTTLTDWFGTKDLNAQSFITSFSPSFTVACDDSETSDRPEDCEASPDVFFSVDIEIEDNL